MKTLKENQEFKLGNYHFKVFGNRDICHFKVKCDTHNSIIWEQFGITKHEIIAKFNLKIRGYPFVKNLKKLTKLLRYILQRAFQNTKWEVTREESIKMAELLLMCGYKWYSSKEEKDMIDGNVKYLFVSYEHIFASKDEDIYEAYVYKEQKPKNFLELHKILLWQA
jgi:hypothetical protein